MLNKRKTWRSRLKTVSRRLGPMPTSFQLILECNGLLWRWCAGELAFFEEGAGVIEGQAAVFEVEEARDVV